MKVSHTKWFELAQFNPEYQMFLHKKHCICISIFISNRSRFPFASILAVCNYKSEINPLVTTIIV